MTFLPGDIDLQKFDWKYYFVTNNTKSLFRQTTYESNEVIFVKENDGEWRQIASLPQHCTQFHIKNTPFEEILKHRKTWQWTFYKDKKDADFIYKKGMRNGRVIVLKKRMGNQWQKVHKSEVPAHLEILEKNKKKINWFYYILESDSSVIFRKGLLEQQWHFYHKKTQGGNWKEINYIPEQAILVNQPDNPED